MIKIIIITSLTFFPLGFIDFFFIISSPLGLGFGSFIKNTNNNENIHCGPQMLWYLHKTTRQFQSLNFPSRFILDVVFLHPTSWLIQNLYYMKHWMVGSKWYHHSCISLRDHKCLLIPFLFHGGLYNNHSVDIVQCFEIVQRLFFYRIMLFLLKFSVPQWS